MCALPITENALIARVKVDPQLDAAETAAFKKELLHKPEHPGICHATLESGI